MGLEDFSEEVDFRQGYSKRSYCEFCDKRTLWKREEVIMGDRKMVMYECNACGFYATREYLNQMEKDRKDMDQ